MSILRKLMNLLLASDPPEDARTARASLETLLVPRRCAVENQGRSAGGPTASDGRLSSDEPEALRPGFLLEHF